MTTTAPLTVLYARIAGILLTIVGIIGLAMANDAETATQVLGLELNLTHNIVHLATGVLGILAGFTLLAYARTYTVVFGVAYTVLGIWGLGSGDAFNPFGMFGNINSADSLLHLIVGLAGIGAWVAARTAESEKTSV